ncbi:MAG: DUF3667 domain-containing protein [Saprospiraceae bacterium]|nr:DUF3667 domain-containing protein [Saprospiraceae bacterium]MBK7810494.1 DUF3667 domain-containing protein [Saprospiraceae bacterium]MBK9630085.1 DUF3667 domain-containing protein [Saprospiraceae bacterium]
MARRRIKSMKCMNCGRSFLEQDNFCPECGQENHSPNQPIRHLFLEFLESLLHFDTKLFTSLKYLYLKPGQMSLEFLNNQRARFVPPMRLYIFISVIFFILISTLGNLNDQVNFKYSDEFNKYGEPDTLRFFNFKYVWNPDSSMSLRQDALESKVIDSLLLNQNLELTFFNRTVLKTFTKFFTGYFSKKALFEKFIKNVSILMFVLMPVFAFLLYLVFIRSKRNYYEFLIFSIHNHTALFSLLIVFILLNRILSSNFWVLLLLIWVVYYFVKSQKVCFAQSYLKTILKVVVTGLAYMFILIVFLVITVIAGFMMV